MDTAIAGDVFRATDWESYVGQPALKERLDIHIEAALRDFRALDHVLLCGPPGSGKTTMARIVADRLGDDFLSLTMPVKPAVFASLLRDFEGGVTFLDEIHRASKREQEDLLPLLEDLRYEGPLYHISWKHLTIIGATTEPESLIPPLYDRFPIKPALEEYTDDDMGRIVEGMGKKIGLEFPWELSVTLGRATGGVPRNARQFVLAARDLVSAQRPASAEAILALCGTDPDGLNGHHRQYLGILHAMNGQAGLTTISAHLRLHPSVLRDLERVLVRLGLISFGPRGRHLTTKGAARVRQAA